MKTHISNVKNSQPASSLPLVQEFAKTSKPSTTADQTDAQPVGPEQSDTREQNRTRMLCCQDASAKARLNLNQPELLDQLSPSNPRKRPFAQEDEFARNTRINTGTEKPSAIAILETAATKKPLTPISMKSQEEAEKLGIPGGGVSRVNLMIAQRMAKKVATAEPPKNRNYSLGERNGDGKYCTVNKSQQLLDGKYIFVRMLNGELRLDKAGEGGNNAHSTLSGHSLEVAYAGEVEFADGEIKAFSNQSGTYLPEATLIHQSGFEGDEGKFTGQPLGQG